MPVNVDSHAGSNTQYDLLSTRPHCVLLPTQCGLVLRRSYCVPSNEYTIPRQIIFM